jgi:biotin carboxyl carrier protein
MKGYRIWLEGRPFDVEILGDPNQAEVQVRVDGELLTVQVSPLHDAGPPATARPTPEPSDARPAATSPASLRPSPAADSRQLVAPLPGTVVQVAVEPGQQVKAGDELLVIEAMKMNNQIRSPRRGTVGELLVSVGQQISHGEPLLTWID